jgi:hypothetical protein
MLKSFACAAALAVASYAMPAAADTCTGTCGTAAPNGVVTAPPAYGPSYQYVSTVNGVDGAGRIGTLGTNGSQLVTSAFTAAAGDALNFYFNYVTSDGSGEFTDYSFAELLKDGAHAAWLFTARTTPSGNTSPGFGLPANDSVLTPSSSAIVPGGPVWSALGASSGDCFDTGCGYTGWIGSNYSIATAGSYQLRLGVTNVGDSGYQSGLAFAGITINNAPIGSVPEPGTWALMILGFGAVGQALRSRRRDAQRSARLA